MSEKIYVCILASGWRAPQNRGLGSTTGSRSAGTIPPADRTAFRTSVDESIAQHLAPTIEPAQEMLSRFLAEQTGLHLELRFNALDPVNVLKSVRPYLREGALQSDPEGVGAGIQSALSIAIARAYAAIVRRSVVLCIEEPELFLHPHACRQFYKLLRSLAEEGIQIIYATHERSFIDLADYESVHIIRKAPNTIISSGIAIAHVPERARLQVLTKFDERMNEAFFANCVILTEGPTDEIACNCALETLGLELDRDSVSVLGLGGTGDLSIVARVLHGFNIPTIVLIDEDPGDRTTEREVTNCRAIVGADNVFLQCPNLETMFGLGQKPNRTEAIELFPRWFIEHTEREVPNIYSEVAARCLVLVG